LREQKRLIDLHTNLAMALLNEIKKREIDNYYALEEAMLSRTAVK